MIDRSNLFPMAVDVEVGNICEGYLRRPWWIVRMVHCLIRGHADFAATDLRIPEDCRGVRIKYCSRCGMIVRVMLHGSYYMRDDAQSGS